MTNFDRNNPLFEVMRDMTADPAPTGAWITWYYDPNSEIDVVTGVHGDELSALRAANNSESKAAFMPYGENIPTTLALVR